MGNLLALSGEAIQHAPVTSDVSARIILTSVRFHLVLFLSFSQRFVKLLISKEQVAIRWLSSRIFFAQCRLLEHGHYSMWSTHIGDWRHQLINNLGDVYTIVCCFQSRSH